MVDRVGFEPIYPTCVGSRYQLCHRPVGAERIGSALLFANYLELKLAVSAGPRSQTFLSLMVSPLLAGAQLVEFAPLALETACMDRSLLHRIVHLQG